MGDTSKQALRTTPFQEKHGVMYGLHVRSRDSKGEAVSVQCRFCVHFGREERQGATLRKKLTTVKVFVPPYRPENYRHHNATQHPKVWAQYQALSPEEKLIFFASPPSPTIVQPCAALSNNTVGEDSGNPIAPARTHHDGDMDLAKEACAQVQALKDVLEDRYFNAVDLLTDPSAARAFLVVAPVDRAGWLQWKLAQHQLASSTTGVKPVSI
ncbi:hypothetical protein DYB32_005489 [Aphanomyces invadans]|uniref:Uncharacterized protein n=1 Tax=Aphanomyces invadans TaxID=157072 RepID=A0A3R7A882_9STRA|nr:hypothetical protein DYB32_005489 [Aphanomyces invadans]